MVVRVVISGNEIILGMSLIKMLKRIGPSIDPWGTPYKLDIASDLILSIFTEFYLFLLNNLGTTSCLYLIEQVYLFTSKALERSRRTSNEILPLSIDL